MQNKSKLNTILLVIVIILLAIGIWAVLSKKQNTSVENYNFPTASDLTPQESTQIKDNVTNLVDYQPNQNFGSVTSTQQPVQLASEKIITDSALNISFAITKGSTAAKGEAHCCPNSWGIHGSDPTNDMESLEMFIPGSNEDPKNWTIGTSIGQKQYGANTFNVYSLNNKMYVFTIIKNNKGFVIQSPMTTPKLINLASITF
jgi:hypothetical protein